MSEPPFQDASEVLCTTCDVLIPVELARPCRSYGWLCRPCVARIVLIYGWDGLDA